jgi:hypothetical protein
MLLMTPTHYLGVVVDSSLSFLLEDDLSMLLIDSCSLPGSSGGLQSLFSPGRRLVHAAGADNVTVYIKCKL